MKTFLIFSLTILTLLPRKSFAVAYSLSCRYSAVTDKSISHYDIVGNLTNTAVDPDGLNLWTHNSYDILSRPLSSQSAIGSRHFHYDLLGRTTNTVDAANKSWKTEFDILGRTRKSFRPSGSAEELAYNALSHRTRFWNAEQKLMAFGTEVIVSVRH